MIVLLYIVFVLLMAIAIVGLLQLIVWGATALVCLISDAAPYWRDIFGGKK